MKHYIRGDGNGGVNMSKSMAMVAVAIIAGITLLILILSNGVKVVQASTIIQETVKDNQEDIVDLEFAIDEMYDTGVALRLDADTRHATIIERLDNIAKQLEQLNEHLMVHPIE